jgi:hypothetical protein
MDRGKVFVFTPAHRMGENHQMLEARVCQLVLGQAGRYTPSGINTAVGQQGDTHVMGLAEEHRAKWLRQ